MVCTFAGPYQPLNRWWKQQDMVRKPQMPYPGAVCHAMNRGDWHKRDTLTSCCALQRSIHFPLDEATVARHPRDTQHKLEFSGQTAV